MGALALLLPFARDLLGRLFPDPQQRADAEARLAQLEQNGQLAELAANTELAKAQLAIRAAEAAHPSVFVAGWQPFIGWTIGAALCFKYVAGPGVQFVARYFGHDVALPQIDAAELWPLLVGMLGLPLAALPGMRAKA